MNRPIVIGTRGSALALKQANMVKEHLQQAGLSVQEECVIITTTGDNQKTWDLEKQGGSGLFTKELEFALQNGAIDLAIHSAKDLPVNLPRDLMIVGYMPREAVHDVLVMREGLSIATLKKMGTGSPRRKNQAIKQFRSAQWVGIRGNVPTRLQKVCDGEVDGTILAAAGLNRLGIQSWPGLIFKNFSIQEMVPAVGQGAIAIEVRTEDAKCIQNHFDKATQEAVEIERAFLRAFGGGCHASYAAHYSDGIIFIFHEKIGYHETPFEYKQWGIEESIQHLLKNLRIN